MIDVKIFNLLVHYGENDQKNLIDLLEDGLLDFLSQGHVWGSNNPAYVKDVKIELSGDRIFLVGYFHRASELEWDFVPKSDYTAKLEHGTQSVMPQARFCIDLLEHKLLWITERGKTHKPHQKNFESYLKYGFFPILRKKYKEIANSLYAEKYGNSSKSERPKIGAFRAEYLKKMKLYRSEFKLKLVPLIADRDVELYFSEKRFKIKRIRITPHISNPTNDELADLFVDIAKFGSEANSYPKLDLTPADKTKGVNKDTIKKVVDKNKSKQLVDLHMTVEDSESPDEKPLLVTNRPEDKSNSERTDVSVQFEFRLSLNDGSVIKKVLKNLEDQGFMDLSKVTDSVKNRFKKFLRKE